MEETLKLVLTVAILITAAKAAGYLSNWFGQPAVLGELSAGVVLGPSLLNMLAWQPFASPHLGETIAQLAELGVILLIFLAGLEIDLRELLNTGKIAAFSGTLGVAVPLLLGLLAARWLQASGMIYHSSHRCRMCWSGANKSSACSSRWSRTRQRCNGSSQQPKRWSVICVPPTAGYYWSYRWTLWWGYRVRRMQIDLDAECDDEVPSTRLTITP